MSARKPRKISELHKLSEAPDYDTKAITANIVSIYGEIEKLEKLVNKITREVKEDRHGEAGEATKIGL